MADSGGTDASARVVFRVSAVGYLVALFLLFGVAPLAFTSDGIQGGRSVLGWGLLLLLVPIVTVLFVWRTATVVDGRGVVVRAVFGSRRMAWDDVRGLSVADRAVYAVLADGSVRLPCVRLADLTEIARVSAGRLPELPEPTPKYPPARRRRR